MAQARFVLIFLQRVNLNNQHINAMNKPGIYTFHLAKGCSLARGFSLVELMLAVTLGLILTTGIFTVYVNNKRSSTLNEAMASMQEGLRYGVKVIEDDVRMAGYQGCVDVNTSVVDVVALDSPSDDLKRTAISGSVIQNNASWLPAPELGSGSSAFSPPASVTPRAGTHTLAVQYAKPPGSALSQVQQIAGTPNSSGPLQLTNAIDVTTGDLALVSTCDAGEIFTVTAATTAADESMSLSHGAGRNLQGSFQQVYGIDSQIAQTIVLPFVTRVYFVADSGDDKPDGTPLYALYQQTMPFDEITNPPVMLIEGVENMRVQFGIGNSNSAVQYVSADSAAYDPDNIRSVRVGLLISSYEAVADDSDTKTYVLAGTSISASGSGTTTAADSYADDNRFRFAANTTAAVRNRRAQD